MKRLSRFQEHKVGCIDNIIDSPKPRCFQSKPHPERGRLDEGVFYDPCGIARAKIGIMDSNRSKAFDIFLIFSKRNIVYPKLFARQYRYLPRDTDHGKAIGTVGGNGDSKNDILQSKRLV